MKLKDIAKEEFYRASYGCAGCAAVLAVRLTIKTLGKNSVYVVPANCISTVSCYYPQAPFFVPFTVMAFAATASALSGISAGFKRRGREDIQVVGFSGDGGTADIGIQALSGAIDCGSKFIYICYDNEAYMNTGIQRSSSTPYGASTTTAPAGKVSIGQVTWKKNMAAIAAAHNIPYVATACPSYPFDLMAKVKKAMATPGPAYMHVISVCPTGWRCAPDLTIKIGRLAVETGIFPLYEVENGSYKLSMELPELRPVQDYFKLQGRFRHLSEDTVKEIQERVNKEYSTLKERAECKQKEKS
jgi:pyruvate ferredoxin oxidoreductase beta subunit